jgi:hypothetical protein
VVPTDLFHEYFVGGLTIKSWGEFRLEITTLRHNEIQKLEIYLKKLLKQVQNLPERTANEATYLMMGRIPVVGELHKRILKTLFFLEGFELALVVILSKFPVFVFHYVLRS